MSHQTFEPLPWDYHGRTQFFWLPIQSFSRKSYPALHTQYSQVSFNERLPTEVSEQVAQFFNSLLRQNSLDNT